MGQNIVNISGKSQNFAKKNRYEMSPTHFSKKIANLSAPIFQQFFQKISWIFGKLFGKPNLKKIKLSVFFFSIIFSNLSFILNLYYLLFYIIILCLIIFPIYLINPIF